MGWEAPVVVPTRQKVCGILCWCGYTPRDYVIMQFGHNDGAPLDDTARARGTIKGIGEEENYCL